MARAVCSATTRYGGIHASASYASRFKQGCQSIISDGHEPQGAETHDWAHVSNEGHCVSTCPSQPRHEQGYQSIASDPQDTQGAGTLNTLPVSACIPLPFSM